jgi:leucine dehydrogenase
MSVFDHSEFSDHEDVVYCHDRSTGLKAIIAVHDTTLGPSLGGLRMWPYASDEEALTDVLRLSRGMTYKAAMAGLALGGGKAVIIGDSRTDKTPALFEAFGKFVDQLGGRYITAEDVGTSVEDIDVVSRTTNHVAGLAELSGDPSPATAWGVFHGIRAAVAYKMQQETLEGIRVAIQGVGHVGYYLCQFLAEAGAELTVTDINANAVQKVVDTFGATVVDTEEIYQADVDVFAPCAMGAVINDQTLPRLKASIIGGSANNQLAEARHGNELLERSILYAPDYVINAGGLINISHERPAYDKTTAYVQSAGIYNTLFDLFRNAEAASINPEKMADKIAETKIFEARQRAENKAA